VGNDGLVPPFGYRGQIIQIFEKLLVICNRKHNGGLRPGLVGQILQVVTHVRKITTTQANVEALKTPNETGEDRQSEAAGIFSGHRADYRLMTRMKDMTPFARFLDLFRAIRTT
jgi:hypothetical protein